MIEDGRAAPAMIAAGAAQQGAAAAEFQPALHFSHHEQGALT